MLISSCEKVLFLKSSILLSSNLPFTVSLCRVYVTLAGVLSSSFTERSDEVIARDPPSSMLKGERVSIKGASLLVVMAIENVVSGRVLPTSSKRTKEKWSSLLSLPSWL